MYGVNHYHQIFCRKGITLSNPKGTSWEHVGGALKYVSCGIYGCWGVNSANQIWFRHGVTPHNCAGTTWVHISGALVQLEVKDYLHDTICCVPITNLLARSLVGINAPRGLRANSVYLFDNVFGLKTKYHRFRCLVSYFS